MFGRVLGAGDGKGDDGASEAVAHGGAVAGRHGGAGGKARRAQSDVCLEDLQVARENHCAVVYEPKRGEFFLTPGMGTETYLNGTRLEGTKMLENGDEIGLGDSLLVFVPFCGKERTWEKW